MRPNTPYAIMARIQALGIVHWPSMYSVLSEHLAPDGSYDHFI